MHIAISGSHGFIGSALTPYLKAHGHEIIRIVRHKPQPGEQALEWNLQTKYVDLEALSRTDAVIHLAGENIFGLWTKNKMKKIRQSRVEGTRLLSESLAQLKKPSVFISASAIGYYGHRGSELLTEQSAGGQGFLASVCQEWEAATRAAERSERRIVTLRNGVVIDKTGGALAKMLPAFRMGLGAQLGNGEQYFSWITLVDLLEIISFILQADGVSGPINAVAPGVVTHADFTKILGETLGKRVRLRIPASLLRLTLREMANEMLLTSTRARPQRLEDLGFRFQYPELRSALHAMLN